MPRVSVENTPQSAITEALHTAQNAISATGPA